MRKLALLGVHKLALLAVRSRRHHAAARRSRRRSSRSYELYQLLKLVPIQNGAIINTNTK